MAEMRAWIGCIGCYNSGALVGDWFDADSIPTDMESFASEIENGYHPDHVADGHEELWVYDHEGFGSLIEGECSPVRAQEVAEVVAELPEYDVEAFAAYVNGIGLAVDSAAVRAFKDDYCQEWDSEANYAQDYYDECGDLSFKHPLFAYVDWERAAKELLAADYWTADSDSGRVFVFRGS